MNFKIIADILTVPFEGDLVSDMDPSLKKAFRRAERKYFFFLSSLMLPLKSAESNVPDFLSGLD